MAMAGKGHWISNDNGVKTGDVAGGYLLRLITPDNQEYNNWSKPGYLNAQPLETSWCACSQISKEGITRQLTTDLLPLY